MFSTNQNKDHNYSQVSISETYYDDSDDNDDDEEDFIQRQIRHQQLEMRRQDDGLDMLSQSASRLGTLSLGISEELGQQNK